jgi:CPA1 family monovalent cation:H+ antiporter
MVGSLAAGMALGWALRPLLAYPRHVPTSLALQFGTTFGVWIAAERMGLSGILTMVAYAMTLARGGGPRIPAQMRVPILSAWETVVFVLNALSFVLIGLQLQPIWTRFASSEQRLQALAVAGAVLLTVIVSRFFWVMGHGALTSRCNPALTGGTWPIRIVVSWSGMRGIVTLAAAFALPETLPGGQAFPFRDLVVLCAFAVVLGTLVIQGLTLRPLIRWLRVGEQDPVVHEVRQGRVHIYRALLEAVADDDSPAAVRLRDHYRHAIAANLDAFSEAASASSPVTDMHARALAAAREAAISLRNRSHIGEAAYRQLVQELDWAEMAAHSATVAGS